MDIKLNEKLYEIDYRLNRALESIQQLIAINKIFGPTALDNPYNENNVEYYSLIHVLRKVVDGCFNNFILGVTAVFDNDRNSISIPNILKHVKSVKGVDIETVDNIFNRVMSFSDVKTGNEIFLRMRTLRDRSIAHADKKFKGIFLEDMSAMYELFICEVTDIVKEVYDICGFTNGDNWTLYENENPIVKVIVSYFTANNCNLDSLIK
jgi:hypothetical protein